jgi:lipopolysaccharide biosynthesis protein
MRQDLTATQRDQVIYELRRKGWTFRRIAKEMDMTAAGCAKAVERILAGGLGKGRDRRAM